jgi:S1-C subfamily serine protease
MRIDFFKRKSFWTLAGVSFLSLIAGLIIAANLNWTHPLSAKTDPPLINGVPSFADLAQKVAPAVVNISTVKRVKGGWRVFDYFMGPRDRGRGPMDDFFERFFGINRNGNSNRRAWVPDFSLTATVISSPTTTWSRTPTRSR